MFGSISDSGVTWRKDLATGDTALVQYTNVRRERTGIHAVVAVGIGNLVLAYDEFNIHRSEERRRLAKAAFEGLGDVLREAWPVKEIEADLLKSSAETPSLWELNRVEIGAFDPTVEIPPVEFAVRPFIVQGGATVYFAAPGSGKSYLLQSQAISIVSGTNGIWNTQIANRVLYVNLERSAQSLARRERALLKAMGLRESGVEYLHAPGTPISSLQRPIKEWVKRTGGGVILDSISRVGLGSLVENDTANRYIDTMHSLGAAWWAAIGHTPRDSGDHLFGSQMFDAGVDIAVKVSSEVQAQTVGLALKITKANDIGRFPTQYIALDFDQPDAPITTIRTAEASDFPELSSTQATTRVNQAKEYITDQGGQATTSQIAEALKIDVGQASRLLQSGKHFVRLPREGRSQPYGVRIESED